MAGRLSENIMAMIAILFMLLGILVFVLINTIDNKTKSVMIVFMCVAFMFTLLLILREKEIFSYVQITENEIQLKRFGKILKAYLLSEVNLIYSMWFVGKVVGSPYPCIIVTSCDEKFYLEYEGLTYNAVKSHGYESKFNYFIIVLDSKRWEKLSICWQREIGINDEILMGVDSFDEKTIRIFFHLIKEHNNKVKV